MTARADPPGPRAGVTVFKRSAVPVIIGGLIALVPAPVAAAQFGAVVSIFSDDRFRGASVSDGRPVGTLDFSYDVRSGLYASLSGTVVATRGEGLKALSAVLNGGYAKRMRSGLTVDFGVFHSRYSHYSRLSSRRDFTEAYAGLAGKNIAGRLSVSPNYFGLARWTAYGEVDAHLDLSPNTQLEAEAGLLVPLGENAAGANLNSQVDSRLGLAQRLGPVTLHAAVSARNSSAPIYGGRGHDRVAIVLGISAAM